MVPPNPRGFAAPPLLKGAFARKVPLRPIARKLEDTLMNDMFDLSAPWWHFVLRALVIYVLVMVLVRLSGKRAVGQFTPFDLVVVILLGNAVQNGINGGDNSLTGAVIMASTLIGLNYLVAMLTSRFRWIEKIVEGQRVHLVKDGKVLEAVLRRELISQHDFEEALRMNNVESVADVDTAMLETKGHISVVPKDKKT